MSSPVSVIASRASAVAPAGKTEMRLLLLEREERVTPLDRGAKGPMSWVRIAMTRDVEEVRQPFGQLLDREHLQLCGDELHRQRKVIEPLAQARLSRGRLQFDTGRLRSREEEGCCVVFAHGWDRALEL